MFSDRRMAGQRLAQALRRFRGPETVVLGLPRGGVPVAAEVAAALSAPLDVIVVRKLGVPFQPELAMGAVGEGGVTIVNHEVMQTLHVSEVELSAVAERERRVVEERAHRFRPASERLTLDGKVAVIVDDGIATGSTARAACAVARASGAALVVLAVPVAPADRHPEHWPEVDEFVCLERPFRFYAVGQFYEDFGQTTDDEVAALLRLAAAATAGDSEQEDSSVVRHLMPEHADEDREASIPIPGAELAGHLTIPARAREVVLFAHGSGSSRHSPRNRYVASVLQEGGLGTLLFDLLTASEEAHRSAVFDIDLLASRLVATSEWLEREPAAAGLPIAYFGASTGAAAALAAAAERPEQSAAATRWSSSSTAGPSAGSPARTGWRSCRGPRTCSRRPARSPRPRTLPGTGSWTTCLASPRCRRGSRRSASSCNDQGLTGGLPTKWADTRPGCRVRDD